MEDVHVPTQQNRHPHNSFRNIKLLEIEIRQKYKIRNHQALGCLSNTSVWSPFFLLLPLNSFNCPENVFICLKSETATDIRVPQYSKPQKAANINQKLTKTL